MTLLTTPLHTPAANDSASGLQPDQGAFSDDLRPVLRRGLGILALGLGGFVAFAAWAPVDQALPGAGTVAVASQRKAVQHPGGGSVATLAVREGDTVRQGQVLLTLDVTAQRAELASVQRQALLLAASRERLQALLAGASALDASPALRRQAAGVDGGSALLATQVQLFNSQRQGQAQGQQQLGTRAAQLRAELAGHTQALQQQRDQRLLVEQQVAQLQDLASQGFYPKIRLTDAQRQLGTAQQDESRTGAELQRTRQALAEAGSTQALRGSEQRAGWETELLDSERQGALLSARAAALAQQMAQASVAAPVAGTVVGLAVHTVGGVVQPAQVLMELVPDNDGLVVDARFTLAAAEKLHAGQPADLHFNSMDRNRTPVLRAEVLTVSADQLEDQRSGQPYMRVRLAVPPAEQARLKAAGATLRPGLPVDVMVQLGERTLLGWLLKPLSDRLTHAFTE